MKICAVYLCGEDAGEAVSFFRAAQNGGSEVTGIFVGEQLPSDAAVYPLSQGIHLKTALPILSPVQTILLAVEQQLTALEPELVLFQNTSYGKELATRLSIRQQGQSLGDVMDFHVDEDGRTVHAHKRIYAQNLHAQYSFSHFPVFLCLQVDQEQEIHSGSVCWREVPVFLEKQSWYRQQQILRSESTDNPLENARIIFAMGRGMSDSHARELLRSLAHRWDASIGVTRTAALSGYHTLSDMLGISGIRVHPELCIIFGASGSMPFMAGVEKSGTLVAINRDPDSLILEQCDYAIVDSCENVLEELARREQLV